jgi:2C-methyl-D-erythritol 2,4-cyclodiphosphate synthase
MLCKFGRTDDLPRRLMEHARDYKRAFKVNADLLLFSIVENQFLSTAEDNLKQYFGINRVEYKNLKGESSRELVVFHKDEMTKIQQHYGMIQTTYIGQLKGLEADIAAIQKELAECKMKLLQEKHKNELKDKDILLRDKEIELLTMKMSFLENRRA